MTNTTIIALMCERHVVFTVRCSANLCATLDKYSVHRHEDVFAPPLGDSAMAMTPLPPSVECHVG